MALTFHDATVAQYLQILPAVAGLVDKAEAWCTEKSLDPAAIIDDRLAPDMFTWAWQIRYAAKHSAGAIQALVAGEFHPDFHEPPHSFAELRGIVTDAITYLETVEVEALEAAQDKEVTFVYRETRRPYVGSRFILSFSQPNFYFHTTTAYAILRARGIEVGKRDFMGRVRTK